jgi:hypothetical protein
MAEDGKIVYKVHIDDSDVEQQAGAAGEKAGSSFGSKLGGALGTAAKIGMAATSAAAAGIAAMTKSAIENYAEYEQLVGGVETLFGESANIVQEYAANAFKTAGLSANEYMETVTSFSASLLQSLGGDTEAAARLADVAITDMADNANKMGSSMESIQNAYQGFAKQNYTMLDNLKLGYGGTKTEMERLIADAEKLDSSFKATRDKNGDLTMSYADIVNAIHIVQTEMGITGTTALEASETISGSVASMKSAWANLVTGIADENANFDELVSNFVDSVATVMGNLLPRIETALSGIGELIEQLAPVIMEAIPSLVENVLPTLIEAALTLVETLVSALIENLPLLLDVGLQIIMALADGLIDALPELIPAIVDVILTIVEKLTEPDTVVKLIEAAFKIMVAIAEGLINAIPVLVERVPEIIKNLLEGFVEQWPAMKQGGMELLQALGDGILSAVTDLVLIVDDVLTSIFDQINDNLIQPALSWGSDMIGNFIDGIVSRAQELWNTVSEIAGSVKDFLGFSEPKKGPLSDFHTYAPDMVDLFAQGLKDNEIKITRTIADVFDVSDALRGVSGSTAADYAAAMPSYASGMLERSASEAISYSSSVTGGATYYIYNTIDADNVKSFNDVVELCQSAETVRRMF